MVFLFTKSPEAPIILLDSPKKKHRPVKSERRPKPQKPRRKISRYSKKK